MSFFFLKKILTNPRAFSAIILSIIFLYFNQSFINQAGFYVSLIIYGSTYLLLKKFFLALLAYEFKGKNMGIPFKKIRNLLLINSSIFLLLPGAKIIFADSTAARFLFFFLILTLYLLLFYLSVKKTAAQGSGGRIIFWMIGNVFLISFASWLVFIFFLSLIL